MLEDDRWPDFLAAFGKRQGEDEFMMLDWRKANNIDRIMDKSIPSSSFQGAFFLFFGVPTPFSFPSLCPAVWSLLALYFLSFLISVLFSFSRATRFCAWSHEDGRAGDCESPGKMVCSERESRVTPASCATSSPACTSTSP